MMMEAQFIQEQRDRRCRDARSSTSYFQMLRMATIQKTTERVIAMSSEIACKLTLLLGLIACAPGAAAGIGPGEAAARSHPAVPDEGQRIVHADFKVVFWYRRADPLASFNYQVYDVRNGEYTPAVEVWMKNVQSKYTAYTAFTRDVDLSVEKGQSDSLKVGSVIKRELTVAAALSGVILGSPINSRGRPFESLQNSPATGNRQTGPFSTDRSFLNASPAPFPVPMPYPRPHP